MTIPDAQGAVSPEGNSGVAGHPDPKIFDRRWVADGDDGGKLAVSDDAG
jgi:hypothetical protein